jgi:hypothetical protein
MRDLLVGSAVRFITSSPAESELSRWVANIEQRRGKKRARLALARKLAIVMLAMWKRGKAMMLAFTERLCPNDEGPASALE